MPACPAGMACGRGWLRKLVEERPDQRARLGAALFEVGVPGTREEMRPGVGNTGGEQRKVVRRREAVLVTVQDQRGRADEGEYVPGVVHVAGQQVPAPGVRGAWRCRPRVVYGHDDVVGRPGSKAARTASHWSSRGRPV